MAVVWEFRLYKQTGARAATFDQWLTFGVFRKVREPGSWAFEIAGGDDRVALFDIDCIFEGWWIDEEAGIALHREFSGWVLDRQTITNPDTGEEVFRVSGRDLSELLVRTIIDTYAGGPLALKSDASETVMKEYVEEQAGPTAAARARSGLSVAADTALGATWTGQRSNKTLQSVCQEIAEVANLYFTIARTGAYTFEFQVSEPTDRSADVIFSTERGNMLAPRAFDDFSKVSNYVKVGGQGEAADRVYTVVSDAVSIARSPQGRREMFLNAADQASVAAYTARGAARLAENAVAIGVDMVVVQIRSCMYGLHYFLGDLVRVVHTPIDTTLRIESVEFYHSSETQSLFVKLGA